MKKLCRNLRVSLFPLCPRVPVIDSRAAAACLQAVLITALCVAAAANTRPAPLKPSDVWPNPGEIKRLSDIGRGKAVIFSPDFSAPGNREFYTRLGFAYFEEASWGRVLDQIEARNREADSGKIEVVVLETHGTNGHGLKLQTSEARRAARSYISVGALQERLAKAGVRACVVAACNAGRLFRPQIYMRLNPRPGDPLFKPATLGIINSTRSYDPPGSAVLVARRADSQIELTNEGTLTELAPVTRMLFGQDSANKQQPLRFVVSDMLIQLITNDPALRLTTGYVKRISAEESSEHQSEILFQRFLSYLNAIAEREKMESQG